RRTRGTLVKFGIYLSTLLVATSVPAATMAATACENLAAVKLKHATVTVAQSIGAGSFTLPGVTDTMKAKTEFCRVALTLKPSADSDIKVEVWLPSSEWNAKFQGIGNGGFGGSIDYQSLLDAVSKGYAS